MVVMCVARAREDRNNSGAAREQVNASTIGEIDAAFTTVVREHEEALFVVPNSFFASRRVQFAILAARHHFGLLFWRLHSPPRKMLIHLSSPQRMPTMHRLDARTRPSGPISAMPAALRRASSNLKEAFLLARSLVSKRDLREGFDPSNPQMAGGEKEGL